MKNKEYLGKYVGEKDYSIWKNHNEELVQKIKAVTIDPLGKTIKTFQYGECEIVQYLGDNQLLIKRENGEFATIDKPEDKEKLLLKINKTYPVKDYFIDNFGDLTSFREHIVDINGGMFNNEHNYQDSGYVMVGFQTYNGTKAIEFEYTKAASNCFLFFDENGNYVCRDYNINLNDYEPISLKDKSEELREEYLSMVKNNIGDLKIEYSEKQDTYYTDDFAYQINLINDGRFDNEIRILKYPNQGTKYYHPRESAYGIKKPKNVVEVDIEDLIKNVNENIDKLFSNIENE